MKTAKRQTKPGAGRPPTGPSGERVSEYPPLTVRIPQATKNQLVSLSALKGTPLWRLVDAAALAYIKSLPDDDRRLLAQFAGRMVP